MMGAPYNWLMDVSALVRKRVESTAVEATAKALSTSVETCLGSAGSSTRLDRCRQPCQRARSLLTIRVTSNSSDASKTQRIRGQGKTLTLLHVDDRCSAIARTSRKAFSRAAAARRLFVHLLVRARTGGSSRARVLSCAGSFGGTGRRTQAQQGTSSPTAQLRMPTDWQARKTHTARASIARIHSQC